MSFRRTVSLHEHEAASHVVRNQQPEHRGRPRRVPGKADRRVQRTRHPDRDLPFREGPGGAWRAICGKTERPFSGLGWKSLGVLELTALPSIPEVVAEGNWKLFEPT
jgi:hypothetical protein